jgi:hypothetical protein
MSDLNEMVGDATRRLLLQLSGNDRHLTEGDQRQPGSTDDRFE